MKIAYITAGAGGMYCGSCMHDNTLARALARRPGIDCLLIPTYTPIRTDEQDVSMPRVFLGGIRVYLEQILPVFRFVPSGLTRWLDRPWLIRRVASLALKTDARRLGALTVSMLRGNQGHQRREIQQLVSWLANDLKPDIVVLSNILIAGCVPELKRQLPVTVVGTLQGDDIFLRDLPDPFQSQALREIQRLGAHFDGFLSNSTYYADFMSSYLQLPREKFRIAPLGIDLRDFQPLLKQQAPLSSHDKRPPTIGYLARLAPEKGLHVAVDAFIKLRARSDVPATTRLAIAGWLGDHRREYVAQQFDKLRAAGLSDAFEYVGSVDRAGKVEFLRRLDVLTVPTTYQEPKGLYVLEALAAGVPVVQPAHGAFPELLAATGGGRLFRPNDSSALAETLAELLRDDAQRVALGLEGQRAVHERFHDDAMAEAALDILRELAGRPRADVTTSCH